MNTVLNYDSSSDEEETDKKLPSVIPSPIVKPNNAAKRGALGAGIKNTFNDSTAIPTSNIELKTTAKITDFVPTSLQRKKKVNQAKEVVQVQKKAVPAPSINLQIGDVFQSNDTQRKPEIRRPLPSVVMSYKEEDEPMEDIQEPELEEPTGKPNKRTIDESKIIDFNLNEFYDRNNELINSGDLNYEDHERQNKKVKYYNSSGTNQLSDLMRFSALNSSKLNSMYEKEKNIKTQTNQKYGK